MLRLFALLFALGLSVADARPVSVVVLNPQVGGNSVLAGSPAVDDDLTKGGGGNDIVGGRCSEWGHRVPCALHYSLTRASVKYCQTLGLIWVQSISGQLCATDQGLLVEEARTNTALWSRDMTNAAWVKVGMGTALNAVGIDGTANSATTLTATGTASSCTASCTILQTLTIGSAAENYSFWVQRVTGSGTVNITINNLVGTAACTVVTTQFTRCTVTATLANPVIGIQMTTLNDVIVVDFNQLELGAFPTSPILTTTTSATRAADNVLVAGSLLTLLVAGQFSGIMSTTAFETTPAINYFWESDATNVRLMHANTGTTASSRSSDATVLTATLGASANYLTSAIKTAIAADSTGRSLVANNGTVVSDAKTFGSPTLVRVGSNSGGTSNFLNSQISRSSLYNSRLSDTTIKSLTCATAIAC